MNRANVQELHRRLQILHTAQRQWRFDMADYLHLGDGSVTYEITADPMQCGAAGCLAGWAAMIAHEQDPDKYPRDWVVAQAHEAAQQWLDLDDEQAEHWFLADWHPAAQTSIIELSEVTLREVLVFLTKVLDRTQRVPVTLTNQELADA